MASPQASTRESGRRSTLPGKRFGVAIPKSTNAVQRTLSIFAPHPSPVALERIKNAEAKANGAAAVAQTALEDDVCSEREADGLKDLMAEYVYCRKSIHNV